MITRRNLIGASAGLSAAAVLTGCGGEQPVAEVPSNPAEVTGKVTHWTYPIGDTQEQAWWGELVAEFNKEYPKVEVSVVVQPWKSRGEALTTAVASKTGPDVIYFNPDFIPRFASQGLLMPVDKILGPERADYVDAAVEALTYEGKVYGVPMLMEVYTPCYNSEVIEKLGFDGPPETWDDLRAVADKALADGMSLADYAAADGSLNGTFYPFLWQAGGEVLDESGKNVAFDGPEGVEALTFLRELADKGALNKDVLSQPAPVFEQSKFARGEQPVAFGMIVEEARGIMGEKARACAPFSGKKMATFGSVGAMCVFNEAKSPDAVAAWIAFASNKANTERFIKAAGYLPPRKSLGDIWADDPDQTLRSKYLDDIRVGVLHPKAREMMDVIAPHIQGCLLGQQDPETALKAAADEVNAMLG
uniref:sugar ABC transporter substrate-binding protein n=1 Tax=Tessaracoccus timonensis TaxID=2161816 RepID=UPI000D54E71D|nr:extracellular solute-binding protein [Tessaracoccus timonensis]